MLFPKLPTKIGDVASLKIPVSYHEDILGFCKTIFSLKKNSILFESVKVKLKKNLKSILLINSAIEVVCWQQDVQINFLNDNGKSLKPLIESKFQNNIIKNSDQKIIIRFKRNTSNTDEISRLQQINQFSVLRELSTSIKSQINEKYSVFLGGIFGFDMLANCEDLPKLPIGKNKCPDYIFYLGETLLIVDHQKKSSKLIANLFGGKHVKKYQHDLIERLNKYNQQLSGLIRFTAKKSTTTISQLNNDCSDEEFEKRVLRAKKSIINGEIFQIVLSRTFSIPSFDNLTAYYNLRKDNPSPYMFYFQNKDFTLFGASPESAVKYDSKSNDIEIYPIAGTRKRGKNKDETINWDLDNRIELELRRNEKENAEHMMLVDLARNDIARIAIKGSRYVKQFLNVDRYSHVMHLVSIVSGKLKPELDALHAYQACMNMGTLSGAPKIRATELISEFEKTRRGSYGGAIGYLLGTGDFDSCIVIRSAFIYDETAYIQSGGGIVYDSIPTLESEETKNKAQAVINAFVKK